MPAARARLWEGSLLDPADLGRAGESQSEDAPGYESIHLAFAAVAFLSASDAS